LDIKKDDKFPFFDEKRKKFYKRQLLRKWGDNSRREDRPNLYYSIQTPEGKKFYPKLPDGSDGCWRWSKEKMQEAIDNNLIEFAVNKNGVLEAYEKIYEDDLNKRYKKFQSLLDDASSTSYGTKEIKNLFGNKIFDRPKPVKLIKILLNIANIAKNDLILDFFSGSATTAHAVMQLNAEDGGNRQFIMVQIPEKVDEKSEAYKAGFRTIAEIGRERIIRAAKKINEEFKDKEYIDDLDFGFRYFKVDSSNFKEAKDISEITQENLFDTVENIRPDRNDLDLLFEVILALGLELTLQIKSKEIAGKKVYFVEHNSLIACFDEEIDETLAAELAKYNPLKVVLKDASFKSDDDKINFEQTCKELSPETDIWVV